MKHCTDINEKIDLILHQILGNNRSVECDKVFEILKTIPCLTDRERSMIFERYDNGYTLQKIADNHNVTRERVRQIEANALRKLRKKIYLRAFLENKTWDVLEVEKAKIIEMEIKNNLEEPAHNLSGIDELDEISVRSYNSLRRAKIETLQDLRKVILGKPIYGEETGYRKIRNFGVKSKLEVITSAINHNIIKQDEVPEGKEGEPWIVTYLKC
jgi:DNA-binding CsgD family transcriptional regulator